MKRTTLLLFGVIGALALYAEEMPDGYYSGINNKKGAALKTALSSIIGGGERYEYGSQSSKPATWTAFPITDIESDGTIWDMYSNIKRYPPNNGLSAASYELDVFTRTESGKNDKLLAMWAMNGDAIKNHTDTLTFHQEDGTQITSTSNLTDGAAAIILKATDEQRYFLIKNINFKTKAAELVVKCAISRDDKTPQQMSVYREDNNTLIKTITLSANDSFPRFTIPKGTKQIKITSPSGNRVSVHQLFIVRGDYKVTETSIAGYPKTVNDLSYQVETAMSSSEPLYYRVTPAGLRTTNTVKVDYDPSTATGIDELVQPSDSQTLKLIKDGQLIILRDGAMYNAQGARIE